MSRERRPRLRARARRRGRRDHAGALPRASTCVVETKPDLTPVSEADRAAEEAIRALVARERPGEGVLGEEFGDDGDGGALDRRPDRRDDELRPRHPGVGRRCSRSSATASSTSGSCRRRRSAAAGGRFAASGAVGGDGERVPRLGGRAARGLRRSRRRRRARCRRAGRRSSRRAWAIRGLERLLAALPRRRGRARRRRPTRRCSSGTTPPSGSSSRRPAAAARPSTGGALAPGGSWLSTNGVLHDEVGSLLATVGGVRDRS